MTIKTEAVSIENSEHYSWGKSCDGWHLVKSQGLSVIQELVPSGCCEIKHLHVKSEQFFYVLSGIATVETDGKVLEVKANYGIYIKAGIAHKLSNLHRESLSFIVISAPPSHGDRVLLEPSVSE